MWVESQGTLCLDLAQIQSIPLSFLIFSILTFPWIIHISTLNKNMTNSHRFTDFELLWLSRNRPWMFIYRANLYVLWRTLKFHVHPRRFLQMKFIWIDRSLTLLFRCCSTSLYRSLVVIKICDINYNLTIVPNLLLFFNHHIKN